MFDIPIMRIGQPYESVEKTELVHHIDGAPLARVSQANSGLISRDVGRMDASVLERFTVRELIGICREAAERFASGALPCGAREQTFDQYVDALSATTGMPITYCRNNARKIYKVMDEIEDVLAGLTRGVDLSILDRGYGVVDGRTLSFFREGASSARCFPAIPLACIRCGFRRLC